MRLLFLFLIGFVALLSAEPVFSQDQECPVRILEGEKATDLAYILKNSSYAERTTTENTVIFSLGPIDCTRAERGVYVDLIYKYNCGPIISDPLIAKLFWDTMFRANFSAESGMSQTHVGAASVRCIIAKENKDFGEDGRPRHHKKNMITGYNSENYPRCEVVNYSGWASGCQ